MAFAHRRAGLVRFLVINHVGTQFGTATTKTRRSGGRCQPSCRGQRPGMFGRGFFLRCLRPIHWFVIPLVVLCAYVIVISHVSTNLVKVIHGSLALQPKNAAKELASSTNTALYSRSSADFATGLLGTFFSDGTSRFCL